jgi:two-component system nitrate/nitrite response regulator NarL
LPFPLPPRGPTPPLGVARPQRCVYSSFPRHRFPRLPSMAAPVSSAPSALVVSDDPLIRAGLRGVLAKGGWAVAGEVESLSRARAAWLELAADAVLWDAGHAAFLEEVPEGPAVLALVEDAAGARAALAAGAAGAVLRASEAATVCAALSAVAQGLSVSPRGLTHRRPVSPRRTLATAEDFTPREREVLALLSEGLPNRAIAERLGISRHTVKFHVNALLQKLGVEGRTEAVVQAARLGLVVL